MINGTKMRRRSTWDKGRFSSVTCLRPVSLVRRLAFCKRILGPYVSLRKSRAATWTTRSKADVDQKIQRQVVYMDTYAPRIGASTGPRNVSSP